MDVSASVLQKLHLSTLRKEYLAIEIQTPSSITNTRYLRNLSHSLKPICQFNIYGLVSNKWSFIVLDLFLTITVW